MVHLVEYYLENWKQSRYRAQYSCTCLIAKKNLNLTGSSATYFSIQITLSFFDPKPEKDQIT